jgi:hypothetical protein
VKRHPIIRTLVDLLGGPCLFPHLTVPQIEELLEERLADMLAQIHAARRESTLHDFIAAHTLAQQATAEDVAARIPRDTSRLATTADAESVVAFTVADRSLPPETEHLVRLANERWSRIPQPRGPLDFKMALRGQQPKKKAAHA